MKKTRMKIVDGSIAPSKLKLNPFQNRAIFDEDKLLSLSHSMKINGQLESVLVYVHPESKEYYLCAGERRYKALHIIQKQFKDDSIPLPERFEMLDAKIGYPETIQEFNECMKNHMYEENEEKISISVYEQASDLRENFRRKLINGKPKYPYSSIAQYVDQRYQFNKIKEFSEEESRIRSNKCKLFSKLLKKAFTTHEIEDEIEFNDGIKDKFLMCKVVELGTIIGLNPVKYGKAREKEKESIKRFFNMTEDDSSDLSDEEYEDYKKYKISKIVTTFYFNCVADIKKHNIDITDSSSVLKWYAMIEDKFEGSKNFFLGSSKAAVPTKVKYEKLGNTIYEKTNKGAKLNIDFTKVPKRAEILFTQLLAVLEEEQKKKVFEENNES